MGLFENFPYTNFHELNLDWIIHTVKALDERVDNIQETILALANQYTDEQVAAVRADFAELEGEFAEFQMQVNQSFANYTAATDKKFAVFQELVNAQIVIMRAEITSAKAELASLLTQAAEYTDVQIAVVEANIPGQIDRAIPKATVYNILEASYMTIQNMFDYLCNLHNPNALMCSAVYQRNNTCAQILGYDKTCREFLTNAANIIVQS